MRAGRIDLGRFAMFAGAVSPSHSPHSDSTTQNKSRARITLPKPPLQQMFKLATFVFFATLLLLSAVSAQQLYTSYGCTCQGSCAARQPALNTNRTVCDTQEGCGLKSASAMSVTGCEFGRLPGCFLGAGRDNLDFADLQLRGK